MTSRFVAGLTLLAVVGSSMAGFATYAYNPYAAATNYHSPATAVTYASHSPIYHAHGQPIVYHQAAAAPVYAKTYAAPSAHFFKSAAVVGPAASTYAAPVLTKAVVAPAPLPTVRTVVNTLPVLKQVEYEASPRYDFSYGVHDSLTGDIKSQVETRDGGNVAGSYSVVDADGYKRTVTYTADDVNGFQAVVQREPILTKLAAIATAAPVAVAPVQQHLQYLPQVAVQQPQQIAHVQPQLPEVVQQTESEPAAVEYPVEQQQQEQQQGQYPENQQFPPYPQFEIPQSAEGSQPDQPENDDSDVVEVRSASDNAEQSASTAAPAPVTEEQRTAEATNKSA